MSNHRYDVQRKFGRPLEQGHPWPRPICPACSEGHVSFNQPEKHENGQSRMDRNHPGWDADWIFGTFYSTGQCENTTCKQIVTAVGTYKVGQSTTVDWGDANSQYATFCTIDYFSPPLTLFRLPEEAPSDVREAVDRAARLLFTDPGLSATALRASVERFLTAVQIPATSPGGNFIPLDARLKEWRQQTGQTRVADLFLAAKWIGNEGTHEVSGLTVDDVLDGVEIIDEALHALFVTPDIDARAQTINANRGRPRSKPAAP